MRRTSILAVVLLVVLGVESIGYAQVTTVEYARTFKAQSLAGTVVDSLGSAVQGSLVEDCASGWRIVKTSTKTDEMGHFSLSAALKSGLHYLRISAPGFDSTLLKVRISSGAHDKELLVRIEVAT